MAVVVVLPGGVPGAGALQIAARQLPGLVQIAQGKGARHLANSMVGPIAPADPIAPFM